MKDFDLEEKMRNYGRPSQIYKIVSTQREIQDNWHQTMQFLIKFKLIFGFDLDTLSRTIEKIA